MTGRKRALVRLPGALLAGAVLLALPAATSASGARADLAPAGAPPILQAPALSEAAATSAASPAHPVTVVGLGDSVVAAAHCGCAGFLSAYADLLTKSGTPATSINLGVSGATSEDLLEQLRGDGPTRQAVAKADVVLIMSGANEAVPVLEQEQTGDCDEECAVQTAETTRTQLTSAVQEVRALRGGQPVQVVLLDYWNVTVDGQVARQRFDAAARAAADRATEETNAAICGAAQDAGALCVDTFVPFRGADGSGDPTSLLADDGDHPDAAGHQVIAQALAAALPSL